MAQDSVLVQILGEKLDGKDGDKDVADLVGEGCVIGLYFSAHWCPPCRTFTPQLAKWYNTFKVTANAGKFEIVFVSSDRDEEGFDEYYGEMPWLALPFGDRDRKQTLSRKFKVSGIPTLVLINAETGKVITGDGRSVVNDDPEGKEFPWIPESFLDIITKCPLLANASGRETKWQDVKADYIGAYFSAHWCGPCRAFTPELVNTYNTINETDKKFEIIYVSSDSDEDTFKEYYGEMPWLAIKFEDGRKKKMSHLFDVSGIPTLVIVERATGKLITDNGRGAIQKDPAGEEFPWIPKPVEELNGYTAPMINEQPALIWLTDESEEQSKEALDTLMPIAIQYFEEESEAEREGKLKFFYTGPNSSEDDIGGSLRGFLRLPDRTPLVFITNIPEQSKFVCDEDDITSGVVQELVDNYKQGDVNWKKVQE